MKTFDTALFELYQEGLISEDEAVRNSDSPNNVRLKIKFAKEDGVGAPQQDNSMGLSLESLNKDGDSIF